MPHTALVRIGWILLFLGCVAPLSAQIEVSGVVTRHETNVPLPGILIRTAETQRFTQTDSSGRFLLNLAVPDTLIVSANQLIEQRLWVNRDTQLHIVLFPYPVDLAEYEILPPILVSSSSVKLNMPAPFLRVSGKDLERDDQIQLAPILNRVPGTYMHSGALNTNRITIRGIGSRSPFSTTRLRVYLDDIPLTGGDGVSSIEDVDLSLIDRIEVWKGPAASLYGAGLGGMIHLQTRWSAEERHLQSTTTTGSYGLIRQVVDVRLSNEAATSGLRAAYHRTQWEGWRENSGFRREGAYLLGSHQLTDRHRLQWIADYTRLQAFIPSSLDSVDFRITPEQAADSWASVNGFEAYDKMLFGLTLESNWWENKSWRLSTRLSPFYRNRNADERRPFNTLNEMSRSLGFRARMMLHRKKKPAAPFPFLTLGMEYFSERYDWQTLETLQSGSGNLLTNNREDRRYYNIFLQHAQTLGDAWTLLAGVNLNNTRYEYVDRLGTDSLDLSGSYSFDPVVSPRIGLTWQAGYQFSVFSTVSHGFSPPTLAETLTPDGAINPDIRPERGWNFELGSRGRLFNRFTWEVSLYRMLIRDLLVARRVGPEQFVGINAGRTQHDGLEMFGQWEQQWGDSRFRWFVTYTLTNYRFTNFVEDGQDFSGNRLTGTAPHQLNAGMDWQSRKGWFGHLTWFYRSAFPILDDNSLSTDAYALWHFRGGYRRTLADRLELEVFAGIRNIFDRQYASMILINAGSFGGSLPRYYYPGLPRNWFAGLRIKYVL